MVFAEISTRFVRNINEISLVMSIIISILFYLQYRHYEKQIEKEEMVDNFLSAREVA